ncbi:MAG: sensor histidine kinase [Bacillaceae bacterium]
MKLSAYMKEKRFFLLINMLLYILFSIFLYKIHVSISFIIIIGIVWFVPLLLSYGMEYMKRRRFYWDLSDGFQSLDKKYILPEIIEEPSFLEGKIVYDILTETSKQMHEHVNMYKDDQLEYREYIETWVHEIKTPIASTKLILENGKDISSIYDELQKVEALVEQVLYYARSSQVSKDYIVREFPLRTIVTKVVQKNAKSFIYKKIKLNLAEIEGVVYSDVKWAEFILNQIVVNAINYCVKPNSEIKIYTTKEAYSLILTIEDNGIGIAEKDIARVFEKGFTGENGREYRKSTGMGLYLCKKLCEKLHLGINIESQKDIGTKVHLIFPISKVLLLES